MRATPRIYADALLSALEGVKASEEKTILRRFIAAVTKRGDRSRLPEIIRAVEKRHIINEGGRWIEIETARELPDRTLAGLTRTFDRKDHVETVIRPNLIAGVRIRVNDDQELDYSLDRRLRKLFS
jgi:F0F1-type ATP synthase delta subunit